MVTALGDDVVGSVVAVVTLCPVAVDVTVTVGTRGDVAGVVTAEVVGEDSTRNRLSVFPSLCLRPLPVLASWRSTGLLLPSSCAFYFLCGSGGLVAEAMNTWSCGPAGWADVLSLSSQAP